MRYLSAVMPMKNDIEYKNQLRHTVTKYWWLVAFMVGLLFSLSSFVPNIILASFSLVALAPLFLTILYLPKKQAYTAGLVFMAAWILPTTYWYYGFMPWWLAFLASFGFVALIANLFHFMNLKDRVVALVLLCVVWAAFTYVRLHLPVMEDWWLPHLGYAAWSNPALLWFGKLLGEASIELVILLSNASIALLIWKRRYIAGGVLGAALVVGSLSAGLAIAKQPFSLPMTVVALQQSVSGGVDAAATDKDVTLLMDKTREALSEDENTVKPVIVVWPENKVPSMQEIRISQFAKVQKVVIAYHTVENNQADKPYKKVQIVDGSGNMILSNYKLHIAPGETATGRFSDNSTKVNGINLSAYVCYDIHYPDSAARMAGASLVVVPLNDAAFGSLQKTFHAADIALRAVQANTDIAVSATTGPTMYVTKTGVVKQQLSYDQNKVLVIQ